MTARIERWSAIAALLWMLGSGSSMHAAAEERVILTGEVRSSEAEAILTPPSNSSPVVLRYYVPDGSVVAPGDMLVRIDPGSSASQIVELQAQIDQTRARVAKERATLAVAALDAELAFRDAEAAFRKAEVEAAIPRDFRSALDYDRFQGELEKTRLEAELLGKVWQDAESDVKRRDEDGALEIAKLEADLRYQSLMVQAAEQRATKAGTVVHAFDSWRGNRFDEGSSAYPGNRIGDVVGNAGYRVVAYATEWERGSLQAGQLMRLHFDALPGHGIEGRIQRIGGAPEAKVEWGDGRYYRVEIAAEGLDTLPLRVGMSVRAGTRLDADAAVEPVVPPKRRKVRMDGEVFAERTLSIDPPVLEELWQLNITQLANDGALVKAGDVIVVFDGSQTQQTLITKQSSLQEKQSELQKLMLELDERERKEELATAQQRADLDKAKRKAQQPATLIGRVEYGKLVIDRDLAEHRMTLMERRQILAADQRREERRLLESELAQLQVAVQGLQQGLASLTVTAPRDGLLMHRSNMSGEKFEVGSQVWRGVSVAEIPDMSTLAVRATLAERDLTRVSQDAAVTVRIQGSGGRVLRGHVRSIGATLHSKSRVLPLPVVDVVVALDESTDGLRPGQAVEVELAAAKQESTP